MWADSRTAMRALAGTPDAMPEAFCSHCGALRTSRTPVCSACGGDLDRELGVAVAVPVLGIVARQPRHLLIALLAALVSVIAVLAFVVLG